jgi:hypothetical protein
MLVRTALEAAASARPGRRKLASAGGGKKDARREPRKAVEPPEDASSSKRSQPPRARARQSARRPDYDLDLTRTHDKHAGQGSYEDNDEVADEDS